MLPTRLTSPRLWTIGIVIVLLGLITNTVTNAQDDPVNNDPPDISLPSSVTTEPGVSVSFAPVVSDVDVGSGNMEVEIDLSDLDGVGGRSVPAGDYGTFSWGGGAGITTDVELDTLASLNTFLATFTYTPPVGFSGMARIVFEIDDQGNTGTGGVLSRTRFMDIIVAAPGDGNPDTNAQPDISLPASVTTQPGVPVSFAPVVSDLDVGNGLMELEIDISDLDGVGGRSVPAADYGTFTSDVEVTTLANLNSTLATFTYTPPVAFSGTARIVFEIDDQGNTGSEFPSVVLSRTRSIDINVTAPGDGNPAVNAQPDITLPSSLTTSIDTPITFSASVSDIDVGNGLMELEIDLSDLDGVGGRSVPTGDYGTFSWGGGSTLTSDVEVTTLANLNTGLAAFTYTPPPGFVGQARIVFEIDDQGNTGSEFPPNVLSRTRFIDIDVAIATSTPTATPTNTPTATPIETPTGTPPDTSTPTFTPSPTSIISALPPTDVPPPPPAPLAADVNSNPDSIVRAGIPDALRTDINIREIVSNGEFPQWQGNALTDGGFIGIQGILDLGVLQAVDIFSPTGLRYFEGGIVICLRGEGTLIYLNAKNAPRIPEIVGSYEVDDFPGFTCITLFEPGMLVMVHETPE
jgi:hypothetical protein